MTARRRSTSRRSSSRRWIASHSSPGVGDPAGLPEQRVEVEHPDPEPAPELDGETRLPGAHGADDGDPFHGPKVRTRSLTRPLAGELLDVGSSVPDGFPASAAEWTAAAPARVSRQPLGDRGGRAAALVWAPCYAIMGPRFSAGVGFAAATLLASVWLVSLRSAVSAVHLTLGVPIRCAVGTATGFVGVSALALWVPGLRDGGWTVLALAVAVFTLTTIWESPRPAPGREEARARRRTIQRPPPTDRRRDRARRQPAVCRRGSRRRRARRHGAPRIDRGAFADHRRAAPRPDRPDRRRPAPHGRSTVCSPRRRVERHQGHRARALLRPRVRPGSARRTDLRRGS